MGKKKKRARAALAANPAGETALNAANIAGTGYAHHGASLFKKNFAAWHASSGNADDDIVDSLDVLRNRSRDLFMGTSLANGALKAIRTNVVGSGLMLVPKIDARFLGLTEEEATEWQDKTVREWCLWAETTSCDAERTKDFYQIQSLVFMSALMSGDVFVSLPVKKRAGDPFTLRISLIESDRVCNPELSEFQLDNIVGGVEVDSTGEVIAYHIANRNPCSLIRNSPDTRVEWVRVPAFGAKTGRPNILQIMPDFERPAQRRGVPVLAPVIEDMKMLGQYNNAELTAAVIASFFTVFVKTESTSQPLDISQMYGMTPSGLRTKDYAMGAGSIVALDPEESIEIADPKRPNANFSAFVEAVAKQIGSSLEVPYELLIKNFTASYSASRASLLEAWKMFRMKRSWLASSFCRPVYEEWLEDAVLLGRIDCPGFFADPAVRAAWSGSEWYGDAQGQLDPLKEANAAKVRIEEGLSTREREAAEMSGQSFRNINETRRQEEFLRKSAGLAAGEDGTAEPVETEETDEETDETN